MIPGMASVIYEQIGRLYVRFVRTRYRMQLRIAAGVGAATALIGGILLARRQPPEG
jgi:hypothetical protein